jgi:hypothetical protein
MVSASLDALAAHFHEWARKGGVGMEVPACRSIADTLTELAQDARGLEAAQIPPGYRLDTRLHPNVVPIAPFRQRRAAAAGLVSNDNTGGTAA